LIGKKPQAVKAAAELLAKRNPGSVAATFDENGAVDVEAFARLLKADTLREAAAAAAKQFAQLDALAGEGEEESTEETAAE
jgi:hypothetical protein